MQAAPAAPSHIPRELLHVAHHRGRHHERDNQDNDSRGGETKVIRSLSRAYAPCDEEDVGQEIYLAVIAIYVAKKETFNETQLRSIIHREYNHVLRQRLNGKEISHRSGVARSRGGSQSRTERTFCTPGHGGPHVRLRGDRH